MIVTGRPAFVLVAAEGGTVTAHWTYEALVLTPDNGPSLAFAYSELETLYSEVGTNIGADEAALEAAKEDGHQEGRDEAAGEYEAYASRARAAANGDAGRLAWALDRIAAGSLSDARLHRYVPSDEEGKPLPRRAFRVAQATAKAAFMAGDGVIISDDTVPVLTFHPEQEVKVNYRAVYAEGSWRSLIRAPNRGRSFYVLPA